VDGVKISCTGGRVQLCPAIATIIETLIQPETKNNNIVVIIRSASRNSEGSCSS
jgi:hypothetical protein